MYQDFHFNEDGSGQLDVLIDASSLLQLSNAFDQKSDTVKNKKLEDIILENLDIIDLDFKIDLIDIIPDSVRTKLSNIEQLSGISLIVRNHKIESKLGLHYEFKSLEDLDMKLEKFSELSSDLKNNKNIDLKDISKIYQGMNVINNFKYSDQLKFKKGKILVNSMKPVENKPEKDVKTNNQQLMKKMVNIETRIFLPGKAKKTKHQGYEIIDKNVILIEDSKIGSINGTKKDIIIKYKKAWWDIF